MLIPHSSRTLLQTACAMMAMLALAQVTHAEDIDIYNGTASGSSSNLVIVLDNAAASSANASFTCSALSVKDPGTSFGFEQCGLYGALTGLENLLKKNQATTPSITQLPLKLGLMYFPQDKSKNGGQFVLPASRNGLGSGDLLPLNSANIQAFKTRVAQLSLAADKGAGNLFSQTLQEGFAFYNGLAGLSGTQYSPASSAEACASNFIVYLTLATNSNKPGGANEGQKALASITGKPFVDIPMGSFKSPYSPYNAAKSQWKNDPADEWSTFMLKPMVGATQYQPVKTYTIILYDGTNPDYEQLMDSTSRRGGSLPIFVRLGDTDGLTAAIDKIARQIMATNSVFAAPVLPVSTNTQGVYANQVYIGMFRPADGGLPRWMGNLKQYKFGLDETNPNDPQVYLGGAELQAGSAYLPKPVLSSAGTGFLDPSAVSFWTSKDTSKLPDSAGGFWLKATDTEEGVDGYDRPDGHRVEKGGVGQQLRLSGLTDLSKRNVYTCTGSNCVQNAALSSMKFDTANAANLGGVATDTARRNNIIRWTRGEDVAVTVLGSGAGPETSTPPDSTIVVRGSVHGDVLHSRPSTLNYKKNALNPNVEGTVVFYGANDGLFRAINGNQPNNPGDASKPLGECEISATCAMATQNASGTTINVLPGGELWSFIPEEFYGGLQRIYDNSVGLTLGEAVSPTRQPKTYFFDGSPSVYQNGNTAWLFLSARRGGRLIYALDISDPTNPKFMWKINQQTPGFGELGQTWSQPKVAVVNVDKDANGNPIGKPVLIFGAGYDLNQDNDVVSSADTMGRGIFIVEAQTGKLLWRAGPGGSTTQCTGTPCLLSTMTYSMPSDITLVNRIPDGDAGMRIDRLYAADTCGNLWRVDLEPQGPNNYGPSTWQAYQMAALGGTGTPKRKFFFPPDVATSKSVDIVVAISGDREHPTYASQATNVQNRFYMIKDTQTGANGLSGSGWSVVDDTNASHLKDATSVQYTPSLTDGWRGFYVNLASAGEKGVNAPTIIGSSVTFGTNQPLPLDSKTCKANLGNARGYQVSYLTGTRSNVLFDGGGMPPSPWFGPVLVRDKEGNKRIIDVSQGTGKPGCNTPDCKSSLGANMPPSSKAKKLRRTYWSRSQDR